MGKIVAKDQSAGAYTAPALSTDVTFPGRGFRAVSCRKRQT
jgi:hypothetical protein